MVHKRPTIPKGQKPPSATRAAKRSAGRTLARRPQPDPPRLGCPTFGCKQGYGHEGICHPRTP
jgi:hypothetical protein